LLGCDRKIADGEKDGARIYAQACARCHGPSGQPPPAMAMQYGVRDLTHDAVQKQMTIEQIRERVAAGEKGMPAFKGMLDADQLDAVAQFVKTFGSATE
jgi:mono/diheme cytochrome c family protein